MRFSEYVTRKMKTRNMVSYTTEYSEDAERNCSGKNKPGGGILTSEEHSRMSETDFSDHFKSEKTLVKWYFQYLENANNLSAVSTIAYLVKEKHARNILSFGCGPAVNELFLKRMFQNDIRMVVTDYDSYIVDSVKRVCPELTAETFDFFKDDPKKICKKYDIDTVIMIGSACSMDDKTYLKFLKNLKKTDVKNIVTFEAGIESSFMRLIRPAGIIVKGLYLYWMKRDEYNKKAYYLENLASYHAFTRTGRMLKKIYRAAGYRYTHIGPVKNDGYRTYIYSYLLKKA